MIIEFAEGRTVDPMPEVMEKLFDKCEILISTKVLELMKKLHSYTSYNNQYRFHRRTRGTDALFSFIVTTGTEGNKVSNLECIGAELGLAPREENVCNILQCREKVYFMLQGEEKN